jgi:hypothetical protein
LHWLSQCFCINKSLFQLFYVHIYSTDDVLKAFPFLSFKLTHPCISNNFFFSFILKLIETFQHRKKNVVFFFLRFSGYNFMWRLQFPVHMNEIKSLDGNKQELKTLYFQQPHQLVCWCLRSSLKLFRVAAVRFLILSFYVVLNLRLMELILKGYDSKSEIFL